jgi:hypothetical protein
VLSSSHDRMVQKLCHDFLTRFRRDCETRLLVCENEIVISLESPRLVRKRLYNIVYYTNDGNETLSKKKRISPEHFTDPKEDPKGPATGSHC